MEYHSLAAFIPSGSSSWDKFWLRFSTHRVAKLKQGLTELTILSAFCILETAQNCSATVLATNPDRLDPLPLELYLS
ncbi:hypothetical protein Oscil6304_3036 [Oscillatoria acuminata PCC 6304]|uniref:Uncharacterized protein n=1 Tax=Oscillatoria acuminata PCC 6304 TaxID=56110 RepID=K9TKF2_9CYAN|nr:hypothetical protein Oscil6304_3036 [Oscillatoria acuminata PCC 6304]